MRNLEDATERFRRGNEALKQDIRPEDLLRVRLPRGTGLNAVGMERVIRWWLDESRIGSLFFDDNQQTRPIFDVLSRLGALRRAKWRSVLRVRG